MAFWFRHLARGRGGAMFDDKALEELKEAAKRWEESLAPTLAKRPERKPSFVNTSGIPIERVYLPFHVADLDYERDLGFPGASPCP